MDLESLTELVKENSQKLQDQTRVLNLLQTEVSFQNDRITKQDEIIKNLTAKVEELETKLLSPTNGQDKIYEDDTQKIWKGAQNLSLSDVVKDVAEQTLMTNSGFVYNAETKLYCNYTTGYYYDPTQELYYNGHTGTYYTYDADKQEYKFHSQVELPNAESKNKTEKKKNKKPSTKTKPQTKQTEDIQIQSAKISHSKSKSKKVDKTVNIETAHQTKTTKSNAVAKVKVNAVEEEKPNEVEEGELSSSSSEDDNEKQVGVSESQSDFGESTSEEEEGDGIKPYPPCIRVIILESNSAQIKKGTLFLVTCMGGTIGSEGLHHAIMLPDPEIEKSHAKIQYMMATEDESNEMKSEEKYFISDLGSRSGTVLNGKRLSEEKQCSDPHEISHGSIVKIGGFSLLMHIHPGSFTCGHCEPGLLIEAVAENVNGGNPKTEKGKSRNAMMRQIKKKYGIERQVAPQELPDADAYTDRSQKRRVIKGSDNPYEKTQVKTLDESIGAENKGFKMLAKMGWSSGKTLGQTGDQGLLEPIKLELKSDRGGLGLSTTPSSFLEINSSGMSEKVVSKKHGNSKESKADRLAITMKRFKQAAEDAKMEVDEKPS